MYADPADKHVRVTKLRFTAAELALLHAAAEKSRLQPAAFAREAVLRSVASIVTPSTDNAR